MHFVYFNKKGTAYAECIKVNMMQDVRKDMCAKEFLIYKDCIMKAVSGD